MKTFKLVIGVILTVISSAYLLFCTTIYLMTSSYGIKASFSIFLIPICTLIIGICLLYSSSNNKKSNQAHHKYTEEERQIYFRYKDYKCKDSSFYMMNNKERLNYYYDNLPSKEQKKLFEYAERVYRKLEDEKYIKK